MEQFKIRQGGFKELRKVIIIKSIPLLLIPAIVGVTLDNFSVSGQESDVNVLPILIPVILGAFAFGLYISVKRQKEIFESYVLTIDQNNITREQHNTPTITITNTDLREIIKNSNGSFTIKENSSLNVIGVPSQIEDYEKLEKLLSEIKQLSSKSKQPFFLQWFYVLVSIVMLGLMAAVFIAKDKIIVGVSGTVLLAVLGYSFFEVQRSKNFDSKIKKGMWLGIFVIASILLVMHNKLIG